MYFVGNCKTGHVKLTQNQSVDGQGAVCNYLCRS